MNNIDKINIDKMIAKFDGNEVEGDTVITKGGQRIDIRDFSYYDLNRLVAILEKIKLHDYNYNMGSTTNFWCVIFTEEDRLQKKSTAMHENSESLIDSVFISIGYFIADFNRKKLEDEKTID